MSEIERCDREIAALRALYDSGHPDEAGILMAMGDWEAEKRMIAAEEVQRLERELERERAARVKAENELAILRQGIGYALKAKMHLEDLLWIRIAN